PVPEKGTPVNRGNRPPCDNGEGNGPLPYPLVSTPRVRYTMKPGLEGGAMPTEFICPNCHISLDEQHLVTTTWTVQSCPNCRAPVRKHEQFRWEDRERLVREDMTAIEAWFTGVVNGRPMSWAKREAAEGGRDVWDIQG